MRKSKYNHIYKLLENSPYICDYVRVYNQIQLTLTLFHKDSGKAYKIVEYSEEGLKDRILDIINIKEV